MNAQPITAWSAATALGPDQASLWRGVLESRSGLRPTRFAVPFTTFAGELPFDLEPLPARLEGYECRQSRLACHLARGLQRDVERVRRRWGSDRVGMVLGTSTGGVAATEAAYREWSRVGAWPSSWDLHRQHAMQATGAVVRAMLEVSGPAWIVSTACSSSAKAFASASRALRAGLADAMIVGGVDTLCELTLRGFHALEVLSATPCRPFARDRDGISLGEGGALFVLEREGEGDVALLGVGESSDAHHMSAPHPEGLGAAAAMRAALLRAGLDPAAVSHVNAHATGTRLNDDAEARAIRDVVGGRVPVSGTKGLTGHALGAAGAIEAAIVLECLRAATIPASLGCEPVDESLGVDVVGASRRADLTAVLSNSFAFGGSNVALLLGRPA